MSRLIIICFVLFSILSCSKKEDDVNIGGDGDQEETAIDSLTVFPLDYSDLKVLVPLGNLNPPGHTFPTNHCYLYLADPAVKVPVHAPGNMTLISIDRSIRSEGGVVKAQDYSLTFSIGNHYRLGFGHISELSPDIAALLSSGKENCNDPYGTGGNTYQQCATSVNYEVTAGQEVGKAGGQDGQYALDMGVYQEDASPPYNAVCPFMFYTREKYAVIKTKFSGFFGTPRTAEPVCGEFDLEVPNSAKGIWQKEGEPLYPEDPHIALAQDNIEPQLPVFSVGLSQTGLSSGVYYYTVQNTGVTNRKFDDVTADGNTYCFDIRLRNETTAMGSILLKMADNKTIDVEYREGCDCSCHTGYAFSDKKVRYVKPDGID